MLFLVLIKSMNIQLIEEIPTLLFIEFTCFFVTIPSPHALPFFSNLHYRFPPAFLNDHTSHTYILSILAFVEWHFTLMCVHVCYDCYVFLSLLNVRLVL
jgi:hypothetical protein